jgi:hypothetical protein
VAQLYTENRKVCQEEPPNLCDAEIITVTWFGVDPNKEEPLLSTSLCSIWLLVASLVSSLTFIECDLCTSESLIHSALYNWTSQKENLEIHLGI